MTRDDIATASKAGANDWPLPGQQLSQNGVDIAKAILKDRTKLVGPKRKPRESGKRMRQISLERKGNPNRLLNLSFEITKMVSYLEILDVVEHGVGDADAFMVTDLYNDLTRLRLWTETSFEVVMAHMGDAAKLETIAKLRRLAADPSAGVGERENSRVLADKLERKRTARLAAV